MQNPDPKDFDRFNDYIAEVLGTREWVVSPRLTARLKRDRYEVAVSQKRYREIEERWQDAHGWAMGFPPEMQPEWLRQAIAVARDNERNAAAERERVSDGYKLTAYRVEWTANSGPSFDMRETWAQARSLRDDLLRLGYSDARVLAPAVMPPYPRARELAGVSRFATTKEGEKIDKRRKATMIALRLRASLAHEYAFAEKTRSRIKGLSLTIADLESQLAQAVARAETAEEELQRLRHPVRMSGKAIHGRGHGKLDAAA